MLKRIFGVLGILLLAACSNSPKQSTQGNIAQYDEAQFTQLIGSLKTNQPDNAKNGQSVVLGAKSNQLNQLYRQWAGTRYRLGGTDRRGIDCSAFMQHIFTQAYGINLPRSTSEQKSVGQKINKNELKQGDLVFFRGNRHVGIYLGNGKFMHASTSQGVVISSMNERYWTRTYTQSRRVI